MKTVFLVVALLLSAEGETYPRPHAAYQFNTLPECVGFVRTQAQGLYNGLVMKLQEEGSMATILDLGCVEMPVDEAQDLMQDYQQKPGIGA